MRELIEFKLDARFILILVVLSGIPFLKVSGQSQQYPPKFISSDYLFQNWTTKDGLPANSIAAVAQTSDGYIWFGTANGLVRFDGSAIKIYNTANYPSLGNNRIRGIATLGESVFIQHTQKKFILFDGLDFEHVNLPGSVNSLWFTRIFQYDSDRIFLPAVGERLFSYSESGFEEVLDNSLEYQQIRKRGSFTWAPNGTELFYEGERILDLGDRINEVIVDREETIWIASYSKGVFKIRRNLFSVFSEEEGLKSRNVYPVTSTKNGTIWLGTYGGGVASIKDEVLETGYLIEGEDRAFVKSILERENGELLVALMGGGIHKYEGGNSFTKYVSPTEKPIYSLFEDSDEVLWVGSRDGLFYKKEDDSWEQFVHPDLNNSSVNVLAESEDGSTWIGTQGKGLFHLKDGNLENITKAEGLSSNRIRSIWIDTAETPDNYTVWVGTEDNGLTLIPVSKGKASPSLIKSLKKSNGLFDNTIHQIIPDTLGRIWMNSNQGVFWVFKNDVYLYQSGSFSEVLSTGFTEVDGLRSREGNGGVYPAGAYSPFGEIWFPSQDGVIQFNPYMIYRNDVIPPVEIEKIETGFGQSYERDAYIELELGDRNLSFMFTSLSLVSPEKNLYKFRLFGFDEEWNEAGSDKKVRYTNLDPGTYQFRVIASNNDGVWNRQGDVVTITVPPYFYESGWFYSLFLFLAGMFIALSMFIMRIRARRDLVLRDQDLENSRSQIKKLKARLSKQEQRKSSLFAYINKELRNPVIDLLTQIENGSNDAHKEVGNLLEYVNQLILLSEIELNRADLHIEKRNLVVLLKEITELISSSEEEKNIELSTNTEEVIIAVDASYCIIIIQNLIGSLLKDENATKVKVQIVEESSICTIKISNDGKAYSHEELHAIFTLFKDYEADLDHRELLGIKLPLVAKLIELHKATVLVHSIPDQGNTFSVVFKKGIAHLNDPKKEDLFEEVV
ncbi:MAG: hypothetical protein ED557_03995 [Balneola sp.]|nr:MAG: hypothetical protein ED557_03995 [Balneola sp.]